MSVLQLPGTWEGNLDELVARANELLPAYLPERDTPSRVREEVNARLVRHYTTQGLLDEPFKLGREARYTRRHLLQLLTLRRLMSEGHGASALEPLLSGKSDAELGDLLSGKGRLDLTPGNQAMAYIQRIRTPSASDVSPPSPPTALPPSTAQRWTRHEIEPGLELNVSDSYRPPRSPSEKARLAQVILDALSTPYRK